MSKTERRIVRLAILLVLLSFFLNSYFNRIAASAQQTTATPSCTTKIDWSDKQARAAQRIAWELLRTEYSEIAAAAIMGNLQHESGFCPWRYESLTYEQSYELLRHTRDDRNAFIYTTHGFGLAGWTGTTNLIRLWDWCKEHGYSVYEIEGQIKFLMEDYKGLYPDSYKRLNSYDLDEISFASEEFRQTYEQAENSEYGQYKRAKYSKSMFAGYCEDIYDIETVAQAPYYFDLHNKVAELNKELGIK